MLKKEYSIPIRLYSKDIGSARMKTCRLSAELTVELSKKKIVYSETILDDTQ